VTEWDAYRALDLAKLKAAMKGDVMVDMRNVYRPDEGAKAGFDYYSIGR
jgi:UDPglucose 6-dehydrogenase